MKYNAKDYLLDFARNQDYWLQALIYEAIETKGDISKERKNEIFTCLQNSSEIEFEIPNTDNKNDEKQIRFIKLIHKKGVNALEPNQTIKFSKNVTILYGMNGAGKSGYFKVLNEVVGGNQRKEVFPNIYSDTTSTIDVQIEYQDENHNLEVLNWDGTTRSIPSFNKCKVFDTSYLNGLLDTRQTDSTLIQPLGLHLFTYLVDIVDIYKQQLINNANHKRVIKPDIDLRYILSEDIRQTFTSHDLTPERKSKIEKLFPFSNEKSDLLKKLKTELESIKQINIQDKITLHKNYKQDIEGLRADLNQASKTLEQHVKDVKYFIQEYKEKAQASHKSRQQFEVLNQIPSNDTKDWKDFILAGEKYAKTITNSEDVCVYCRQVLRDDTSINIVKSYSSFLRDKSEQALKKVLDEMEIKKQLIERLPIDFKLPPNINHLFKEDNIDGKSINEIVIEIEKNHSAIKAKLIDNLDSKENGQATNLKSCDKLIAYLDGQISKLQSKLDTFSDEEKSKKERLQSIENQVSEILENESISNQKTIIEEWFRISEEERKIRNKAHYINTKSLSSLSKKAHTNLLTKSLKLTFNEELAKIGYPNLDVDIKSAGTKKGRSSTKLVLTKDKEVKLILSEGEQKAVALALFIAEIRLQKTTNPIILDDPVNSLDHKIAGKFTERILELDNQIILFNHNRLFLDAFETSKVNHICKTTESDCNNNKGKHIKVYSVISQGRNSKGILRNYKGNYARNHIREAKRLLQSIPFTEEMKTASLLRVTVECLIDEVIFNHQIPTRFSNKNSRIAWQDLKEMKNGSTIIDTLEKIHSRVSGGEMHNGTEKKENPISAEEFNQMINDLENIMQN